MNVLFLDMDGVLNNSYLTRKWFDKRYLEYEDKKLDFNNDYELWDKIRKEFNEMTCQGKEYIFPELANRLNEVIEKVDLKIIWSSTWRLLPEYKDIENAREMLKRHGINGDALIEYTGHNDYIHRDHAYRARIDEILSFVEKNDLGISKKDKLGAIDDLNLKSLEKYGIKFFQTEMEFGLTEEIKNNMIDYYLK